MNKFKCLAVLPQIGEEIIFQHRVLPSDDMQESVGKVLGIKEENKETYILTDVGSHTKKFLFRSST